MKVIFLDFDGVLNSHKWIGANQHLFETDRLFMHRDVDPEAVERLNRIVDATGAEVVVSSTWRRMNSRGMLQFILRKHGFNGFVKDVTPILGTRRGFEIQQWLDEHGPVESFTIIDDDSDMEHLMDKLVKTSFDDGLQDRHVEQAIAMLGAKEKAA